MNNKIFKKFCGILGYRLIDKNLFKNNRILSEFNVLNLNEVLKNLFSKNKINQIIQIGANDGQSFDELSYFIKKNKTNSVLVEPIVENFRKLQTHYKNLDFIKLENSAISIYDEVSKLYKVNSKYTSKYSSHISAIPSFDEKHLINHGVNKKHIITELVTPITIKKLIAKYNINNLDLLFVDTEGYDGKIIYDFLDSSNLRPFMIFEYIHIHNDTFLNLIKKLIEKKYSFFNVGENIICFPNDKKIIFELN
jgi:FkbM family methyltransferase